MTAHTKSRVGRDMARLLIPTDHVTGFAGGKMTLVPGVRTMKLLVADGRITCALQRGSCSIAAGVHLCHLYAHLERGI